MNSYARFNTFQNSKQTTERPWAPNETPTKGVVQAKIAPSKIPAKGEFPAQRRIPFQSDICQPKKS